jgi:hypothetical protein
MGLDDTRASQPLCMQMSQQFFSPNPNRQTSTELGPSLRSFEFIFVARRACNAAAWDGFGIPCIACLQPPRI